MDRIAEAVGRAKQAVYEALKALYGPRQAVATLAGLAESDASKRQAVEASDALTKIARLAADIHAALDEICADYRMDTPVAPGAAPLPVLSGDGLRPAPRGSEESAGGLATWPGHGFFGEHSAAVPPRSCCVSRAIRLGTLALRARDAQRGLAGEARDLAGEASAG